MIAREDYRAITRRITDRLDASRGYIRTEEYFFEVLPENELLLARIYRAHYGVQLASSPSDTVSNAFNNATCPSMR